MALRYVDIMNSNRVVNRIQFILEGKDRFLLISVVIRTLTVLHLHMVFDQVSVLEYNPWVIIGVIQSNKIHGQKYMDQNIILLSTYIHGLIQMCYVVHGYQYMLDLHTILGYVKRIVFNIQWVLVLCSRIKWCVPQVYHSNTIYIHMIIYMVQV